MPVTVELTEYELNLAILAVSIFTAQSIGNCDAETKLDLLSLMCKLEAKFNAN